jgi:DNA-binding transcriptional MocR family regulator
MYRYLQIAQHVTRLLESGAVRPGQRIPSVRRLSRQFNVSTNTVLQAISVVEARGALDARRRSGYYARAAASPPAALPRASSPRRGAQRVLGDRVIGFFRSMRVAAAIPFAAATIAPELLPVRQLARATRHVVHDAGARALAYDPMPGYAPLRREIARRLVATSCAVSADEIITTVGAIEALHLALAAVTAPGDAIVVESPCYFGILQLAARLRLRVLELPTDAVRGISIKHVARALEHHRIAACIVVPNFSNPLGSAMPPLDKQRLVEICRDARVPVIESDVYSELTFDATRPLPLKAFDLDGWVIHCSSFSKTMAPSYRVGWICPGRFFDAVELTKFAHTVASPTVTQAAIAEVLASGGYDRHLRTLRRTLAAQLARMRSRVIDAFPAGTRASSPRGGFLLWVEMPASAVDAVELQRRALRHGISIAPGAMFTTGPGFDHCIRLSCGYPVTPSHDRAIAALGGMARGAGAAG